MLVIRRSEAKRIIDMQDVIRAVEGAVASCSLGTANIPLRTPIETHKGLGLFMPGLIRDSGVMGMKLVSIFPGNPAAGLPTTTAILILNSVETGVPLAVMDASFITAMRTGAASGVATKHLARKDSRKLVVFGAGAQARTQVEAVLAVRSIESVEICDTSQERAEAMAAELRERFGVTACASADFGEAVSGADIIATATTSTSPVFDGRLVRSGTHINAVGAYKPETQEIDEFIVARADRFVSDSREGALKEVGDLLRPLAKGLISAQRVDAELGDLVLLRTPGRRTDNEITLYKGVGLAALDLATAKVVYDRAIEQKAGIEIDLFS